MALFGVRKNTLRIVVFLWVLCVYSECEHARRQWRIQNIAELNNNNNRMITVFSYLSTLFSCKVSTKHWAIEMDLLARNAHKIWWWFAFFKYNIYLSKTTRKKRKKKMMTCYNIPRHIQICVCPCCSRVNRRNFANSNDRRGQKNNEFHLHFLQSFLRISSHLTLISYIAHDFLVYFKCL